MNQNMMQTTISGSAAGSTSNFSSETMIKIAPGTSKEIVDDSAAMMMKDFIENAQFGKVVTALLTLNQRNLLVLT